MNRTELAGRISKRTGMDVNVVESVIEALARWGSEGNERDLVYCLLNRAIEISNYDYRSRQDSVFRQKELRENKRGKET